ncbi:TolC family protein [Mariniradius sediminis]|uniref:TolC family protein n=1 Tax=Mariniradius sediminis TaxID=2909237 RepID=A0ABS9BS10_9BACT|nr:TolC family protein [Mariniradius sediminis]MCF1750827.1 TolC family protein [Mariniradius sediminis]
MLVNIYIQKSVLIGLLLASAPVSAQVKMWTLDECVDSAWAYNKTLQIAQNNQDIAVLKNQEAKASLLPKVFLQGDYRYFTELPIQLMPQSAFGGPEGVFKEIQFGVPHNISANLGFKMPLYDPQVTGAIKASETLQELSSLQAQKTKEQVYLEVANLYYNAQILKNTLDFLQKNLANSQRLEKNTRLLYEQTLAQRTDWDKVVLQETQLRSAITQAQSQFQSVLNALKFVIGLDSEREIDVPMDIEGAISDHGEFQKSLDHKIQEKKAALTLQELKTLQNTRIPTLALYGSYGRTGFGFTGDPQSFLNFYPVSFTGIQLNFPVFNGTITNKKIRQKRIELENQQLQKEWISAQTSMLYENAQLQLKASKTQLETAQGQIRLAESVYQRTLLQQREGLVNLTEVLLAENTLREAQQHYLSSMVDYLKADLEIKKTSGNLLK